MKTRLTTAVIVTLLAIGLFYGIQTQAASNRLKPGIDFNGPHFNLNVHGVPDGTDIDKFKDDTVGPGRHTIFVPLSTVDPETGLPYNITIYFGFSLIMNWTVLDCDATGEGHDASIVLPAYIYVDTDGDGTEETAQRVSYYLVYVVGLGKPSDTALTIIYPQVAHNGSWTAYEFTEDKLTVPSRMKGGKGGTGQLVWYNATNLFFVDVTFYNGTTNIYYYDTWVFDVPGLEDYWWNVQNDGTRLMQIRFYPVLR